MTESRVPSRDLTPGARLRWRDASTVTLDRRKDPAEHHSDPDGIPFNPGWWLRDNQGGLADFVIDDPDNEWEVVPDE